MTTTSIDDLFVHNKEWAAQMERDRPGFFTGLMSQQKPKYMWIGCSDSRVPANQITGLEPGEVFVHRNVANVVVHSDLNCLSVMQFAVDHLKVRHIIVVGHSNCGGVKAALYDTRVGLVENWIRHVQDVRHMHREWLDTVPEARRVDALCELNVLEQARNACHTTVVRDAWARGQEIVVHGWVYGLHNGLLEDLAVTAASAADVDPAYRQALAAVKQRYAAG